MILAAGYGKRLRPMTEHTPKPLICVGGKPLIVWHIERLAHAGIKHIVINHSWLGEQIVQRLQDGHDWGVQIRYSAEEQPLETATGVKKALPLLQDAPFLLISSDIWCPWPVSRLLQAGQGLDGHALLGHLLLVNNPAHHPQGDMYFERGDRIRARSSQAPDRTAFTYSGLAAVHPRLFAACDDHTPMPLRVPLGQAMQADQIAASHLDAPWFDVGTMARLQALEHYLAQNPQEVMI